MALASFYSAVEGKHHWLPCMQAGIRKVLFSFLHLEKTDLNMIRERKQQYPDMEVFVDSGAHTFQSDKKRYASWSLNDFEEYIKRYVKWLRANRDDISACVELDIDWNVGAAVVEQWNKKYFIPLLNDGFPVLFVWHRQRGIEGWEEMCATYPWVGLPGEFSNLPDFNKYITVARRYTTRVHGFGASKQSDFRDWAWAWFSADSTTWKSAERYGVLIHWDERKQKLVMDEDKHNRHLYRADMEAAGVNADSIIRDTDYREVTKYALISMRRMEKFYERKYAERTFYHELRLPHPALASQLPEAPVRAWWAKLKGAQLCAQHSETTQWQTLRMYVAALAAAQYGLPAWIESKLPGAQAFLGAYFDKLIRPSIAEPRLLQKAVAEFYAPSPPPALERVEVEHYQPTNNPPKARPPEDLGLDDLAYSAEALISKTFEQEI